MNKKRQSFFGTMGRADLGIHLLILRLNFERITLMTISEQYLEQILKEMRYQTEILCEIRADIKRINADSSFIANDGLSMIQRTANASERISEVTEAIFRK